jgi:tryptophan-rich sensory protein
MGSPVDAPRIFGLSLAWVPYAAGPVWLGLSALMGWGAWTAFRSGAPDARLHGYLVLGFMALCWLHPLYTGIAAAFGRQTLAGLVGAAVTLLVALPVLAFVRASSAQAAAAIAVVCVWIGMASVYLWQLLEMERART